MWPVLRAIGVGVLAVAWAIASYFNSAGGVPSSGGVALALAPLSLAGAMALWRMPQRGLAVALAVASVAVLWWSWPLLKHRIATLYFLEHLGVYSVLAVFFARSLSGPGESLVTQMARRVHGGVLSDAQMRYTRQVTLAWTLFFAAMVLVSVVLFVWAPLPAWSAFATLLGGPLIGAMFVGELLVRRWLLPNEARASLGETVRAWRTRGSDTQP